MRNSWTKEVPTKTGWYPIVLDGNTEEVAYLDRQDFSGRLIAKGIGGQFDIERIRWWGQRINFPHMPEKDKHE